MGNDIRRKLVLSLMLGSSNIKSYPKRRQQICCIFKRRISHSILTEMKSRKLTRNTAWKRKNWKRQYTPANCWSQAGIDFSMMWFSLVISENKPGLFVVIFCLLYHFYRCFIRKKVLFISLRVITKTMWFGSGMMDVIAEYWNQKFCWAWHTVSCRIVSKRPETTARKTIGKWNC